MTGIEKIIKQTEERTGLKIMFYKEGVSTLGVPICDRQFENVVDDGTYTFFRFFYKNSSYIGVIEGTGKIEKNYAILLPSYIESFSEKEYDLSKSEFMKRIIMGECSSMGIYKYMSKYSVGKNPCFVIDLKIKNHMDEAITLISQYNGNSLDTVVKINNTDCVLVKYIDERSEEYQSTVDYAEFLVQSIKEELGTDTLAGVGSIVKGLKDISLSYMQASAAIRYAEIFQSKGLVHSYREFILVKMLEEVPESKLAEYLNELTDEHSKDIFEDEEMLNTAEEFLNNSLNVSETSRSIYVHRNTLLYRLDKIEKATGLNIRSFSDAVTFRVLTILYKLFEK